MEKRVRTTPMVCLEPKPIKIDGLVAQAPGTAMYPDDWRMISAIAESMLCSGRTPEEKYLVVIIRYEVVGLVSDPRGEYTLAELATFDFAD